MNSNTNTHPGMIETVKDKSVAATEGTGQIVEKVVDTTAHVLTTTVKDTAKVGGEVGAAATGLVEGAIKGTEGLAIGAEHAAAAIVGGAFKATGEVGTAAVDSVRNVVTKPIPSENAAVQGPEPATVRK